MNARLRLFIPLLIFAVVALVFLTLEKRIGSGEYDPSNLPSAMLGQSVPAFNLSRLMDAEQVVDAEDIVGQAALLNVWATWCIACRVEHAYLNELASQGVPIFGLNYKDERAAAVQWLQRLGNPYRLNIFDFKGSLGLDLGVYGAPETYVIDAQGIIRYRHVGILDAKVWREKIEPLGLQWAVAQAQGAAL